MRLTTKLTLDCKPLVAMAVVFYGAVARCEEGGATQQTRDHQAPTTLTQDAVYRGFAAAFGELVRATVYSQGKQLAEKPVDPDMRIWIDVTGRRKTRAKLIDFVEGQVYLQRENGEVTSISIARLSPADQKFIRSTHRERTLPKASDTSSSGTFARRGNSRVGSSDGGVAPSQLRRAVELGYKPNPTKEDIRELLLLDARVAVQKGLMTPEQFEEYTGQPY